MKPRKLRILLTGGGTGGHIFPLVAVAERLRIEEKSRGMPITARYFGSPGAYRFVLSAAGVKVSTIASSKWRRYFSIANFFEPFKAAIGLVQALWKIYWYMPDVAFSKGGPGALVILWVCRWYRIPYIVHESDTIPGLTNLISGKRAKIVEVAFPGAGEYFSFRKGEVKLVGMPVRLELLTERKEQERAKGELGFDPRLPLVLILGGSQGAEPINDFILEHAATLLAKFQVFHQVGVKNFREYKGEYDFTAEKLSPAAQQNYKMTPFLVHEMKTALAASDVVISRAGASAIFEIASFGKPSILIPLPEAANDHQRQNAYAYEKAGACVVIEQENLLANLLVSQIEKIFTNAEYRAKLSSAARQFFAPNAANVIADDIIRVGSGT